MLDADAGDGLCDQLIDYFGADRSRAEVRLIVGGQEVGYLAREDLYEEAILVDRGFGGSSYAHVPGLPTGGGGVLVLRCPVPGCPEPPVMAMSYDEDYAPRCAAHPGTALVLDGA
jgi:hypothetical protein